MSPHPTRAAANLANRIRALEEHPFNCALLDANL
jgi:hypothetical protein